MRGGSRTGAAGLVCVASLVVTCASGHDWSLGEPDRSSGGLSVDESRMSAVVADGAVDLELVVSRRSASGALDGVLAVWLQGLGGEVLDEATALFAMAPGQSEAAVRVSGLAGVPAGTAPGDLASYVVRYRASAGRGELSGRRSLFVMARRIGTVLLGPDDLYDGQPAELRLSATEPGSGRPLGGAEVEVFLETPGEGEDAEPVRRPLYRGITDEHGIAPVRITPAEVAGPAALLVVTRHEDRASESRHPVTVRRAHRVLLTTDKPLYQPGQTIHLRALSLRLPDEAPSAGAAVTFEVLDSQGNIVFREEHQANDFGVAATTFQLARMVNMGRYTVRATVDDAVQERTVTVDRYALPRFAVGFEADRPFYRPGERLHGQVAADYTFGQPVAGGSVRVRAAQLDVDWVEFAELHGTTGEDGRFDFDLELPSYFVGLPLEQGGGLVRLAVQVTDAAGQAFELERAVTVARGAVGAVLVPERPVLVPGVGNQVFVLTADPTGSPVAARCHVSVDGAAPFPIRSDDRGFASFEVSPRAGEPLRVEVEVEDGAGGSVTTAQTFAASGSALETVLLRTDRALYEVGETAELTIYSPRREDRVYLDVVRLGQTLLTDIVEVEEGWTTVPLDLADGLAGSLTVSVYYLASTGDIVRDQRTIFVAGASGLTLRMVADQPVYRPAETARISFQVEDAAGDGVQAAVGLQVVDEAVFALSEQRPGLERIYFQLEEELRQPSYEVHGFQPDAIFGEGEPDPGDSAAQQAARVLFAAQGGRTPFGLDFSSERELGPRVAAHAGAAVRRDAQAVAGWLAAHLDGTVFGDREAEARRWVLASREGWYDPWGRRYQADYASSSLVLTSSGPDESWATGDDATATAWVSMWGEPGGGDWDFAEDGAAGGRNDDAEPSAPPSAGGGGDPRIRQWFPETLLVEPSIITDEAGRATVELPLADSITTWRASAVASSRRGELGSAALGVTVFQDFFVDLALPATMTLGDEITVPVVVYNYLDEPQDVQIEVTRAGWFTLLSAELQRVRLAAREVTSVPLTLRVEAVGWHELQAVGRAGELADGLRRRIEVMPSGQRVDRSASDVLEGSAGGSRVRFVHDVPAAAVADASELLVKVYPGAFAQAIEGLDSILRMPSGCFEQTSSTTYPNVLVLDYMQRTGAITPEVEMRAREYVNLGYQRLLTFEVPGGGFEWFGSPPAHRILTAYGLMEFSDMARVHPVDPAVLTRTAAWLAAQQQPDGSFVPDAGGIPEGAINNYQGSTYRTTAYVLWALLEAGYTGPSVSRAVSHLEGRSGEAADAYARAITVHALLSAGRTDGVTRELLAELAAEAVVDGGAASWGGEDGSMGLTYSMGDAHVLETTALVVDAFLRARAYSELANQGIAYLVRSKDSFGNWETTQATVYALRALIRSMDTAGDEADATIDVIHNGALVQSLRVTPADYDVLRQVDLHELVVEGGRNVVELVMRGSGSLMYQAVGTYWLPWDEVPAEPVGPLSIDVSYDRTSLAVDDTVRTEVTLANNTAGPLLMVMVDLGIPPGFDLVTPDLDALVAAGLVRRHEQTGRQVLLYVDELPAGPPVVLGYRLLARNPMRGEAPPASTYLYYDPAIRASSPPTTIEVD